MTNCRTFHDTVTRLRRFFTARGFIEVHPQSQLSILAACEDPGTIATFDYGGTPWPLPQTGQMHLEYDLLRNPAEAGFFCVTTSYRQEPNPIPGRHDVIFPMFEFEMPGGVDALRDMEAELCAELGLADPSEFREGLYEDVARDYGVREVTAGIEERIWRERGPVFFLRDFPLYTSPFWNMRVENGRARKIDVLLYGMETIGSAERSTDTEAMRHNFYTISGGQYAETLFARFGQKRVEAELDDFLGLNFFQRCGGGIGMTRMMRAMGLAAARTAGHAVDGVASLAAANGRALNGVPGNDGLRNDGPRNDGLRNDGPGNDAWTYDSSTEKRRAIA